MLHKDFSANGIYTENFHADFIPVRNSHHEISHNMWFNPLVIMHPPLLLNIFTITFKPFVTCSDSYYNHIYSDEHHFSSGEG